MDILLVARGLAVQKVLGPQLCLCPTFLSISVPRPAPASATHREESLRAVFILPEVLTHPSDLGEGAREPAAQRGESP